jgi:hypothetical protein
MYYSKFKSRIYKNVSWDVTSCGRAETYRRFRRACCLRLQAVRLLASFFRAWVDIWVILKPVNPVSWHDTAHSWPSPCLHYGCEHRTDPKLLFKDANVLQKVIGYTARSISTVSHILHISSIQSAALNRVRQVRLRVTSISALFSMSHSSSAKKKMKSGDKMVLSPLR